MLQDDSDRRITRRVALQLGAGAGLVAASAPYVALHGHDGAVDAVDLADAELALSPNPSWPPPPIVTRAQWGANEARRKGGRSYDSSIAKLVVHHTGTPNSITDYKALCRGIFNSETAGAYIDIAYNWLVDPHGRIYEGRWARGYPAGHPHTGESSGGRNVRGAHASYHNTRTVGVALMGNYDLISPSNAMMDGLVTLLAWKCARWGLSPTGRSVYVGSNGVPSNLWNICGHRDVNPTACPGGKFYPMLSNIRARVAARLTGAGYVIASRSAQVYAFGGAVAASTQGIWAPYGINGIAGAAKGSGYWLFTADGAVFSYAGARFFGSLHGRRLNAPVVGMAPTPSNNGYWIVAQDGGIFTFGDAKFYGSTGNRRLNAPVLGMTPTKTGRGYWVYARDGGIFSFGDAKFFGSTGNIRLARPVVSMAARPQGDGYWMIAEDGGVFAFGRAPFRGSGARQNTNSPCVAMLASTTGRGYAMVRRNGSVSTYGDAPNLGNAYGRVRGGAVGMTGRLKPI